MELKILTDEVKTIFGISDISQLGEMMKLCVQSADKEKMDAFVQLVSADLSKDWLQMIFQYNSADRKEKKQDFTPQNLAKFLSKLIGNSGKTIDMCAGTGALMIQRWNEHPDNKFICFELDEKVIPYLLFNLVIRNMNAEVYRADVLQNSIYDQWIIRKGEKYGSVSYIKPTI